MNLLPKDPVEIVELATKTVVLLLRLEERKKNLCQY
jgi:hypothetical protein